MRLEILSLDEAVKYEPKDKSYGIRILDEFGRIDLDLKECKNWIEINKYYFDDMWPRDWKEYSWYDTKNEDFQKYLKDQQKEYPKMTEGSLLSYFESRGHPYGRCTLFDEPLAKRILNDFEKVKDEIDNLVIHCNRGKNRSPAVGIAMNEIYGWRIEGLREKFPEYRRYVYDVMVRASKNQ